MLATGQRGRIYCVCQTLTVEELWQGPSEGGQDGQLKEQASEAIGLIFDASCILSSE